MSAQRLTSPSSTMNRVALARKRPGLAGAASLMIADLLAFSGTKFNPDGPSVSGRGDLRQNFLGRTGERQQQAGDRLDVVKMRMRQMRGNAFPRVGGNGGDAVVFGIEPGFPIRLAMRFDLDMRVALKPLDENEIGGAHVA